jgi:hypothetical protein
VAYSLSTQKDMSAGFIYIYIYILFGLLSLSLSPPCFIKGRGEHYHNDETKHMLGATTPFFLFFFLAPPFQPPLGEDHGILFMKCRDEEKDVSFS